MSLRTTTQVFAIKILSRRRWLAVIGDEQITLMFAVFWFGEWRLGFLIQDADKMELLSSLCSSSIALSCSLSSGVKVLSHGTNFIMIW